ncbi:MAG: cobalamin adenosyltransferase [Brevinema sp.]
MALITEAILRRVFLLNGIPNEYKISPQDTLTPSAFDFLKDRKVKVLFQNSDLEFSKPLNKEEWETDTQFKNFYTGEIMDSKLESMTHLFENILVYKDDPRIILRGKLDTLQSHIIEAQILFQEKKRSDLVESLTDILNFTREILRCEVLNIEFPDREILGMTSQEIREKSHNPQKYFHLKQMVLVHYRQGAIVAKCNTLRAYSRECELSAVQAYRSGDHINQNSLIQALNRLSSSFHILMYQELSQK